MWMIYINLIGTPEELEKIADYLKKEFENKKVLGLEVPYLSAIGALLYLTQCTRPDIAFSVNLLARYNSASTQRH